MTTGQPVERVRCPRCEIQIPITATRCPGCDLALTPEMLDGTYRQASKLPTWFGIALGVVMVVGALAVAVWQYVTVTHTFVGIRFLVLLGVGLVGLAIAVVSYARNRRPT